MARAASCGHGSPWIIGCSPRDICSHGFQGASLGAALNQTLVPALPSTELTPGALRPSLSNVVGVGVVGAWHGPHCPCHQQGLKRAEMHQGLQQTLVLESGQLISDEGSWGCKNVAIWGALQEQKALERGLGPCTLPHQPCRGAGGASAPLHLGDSGELCPPSLWPGGLLLSQHVGWARRG